MSDVIKTGWLNSKNGDKFAPKTLSSMVQTPEGVLLEDKINEEINELATQLDGKLAKNHGAANVGKILVVGSDGNLTLIDMPEGGASGDVTGVLDDSNNILLTGNLADGTYTLKYENADGTYTEIGSLVVGAVEPEVPAYTNLFDPSTASINTRWSVSSAVSSAKAGFVISELVDFGKITTIPTVDNASDALTLHIRPNGMFQALSECNITYYDINGVAIGGGYLQGSTSGIKMGTDENGDTYIYLAAFGGQKDVRCFRVSLKVSDSAITTDDIQDIIITLNEPITD